MTQERKALVERLSYIAVILEANKDKFAVPDHIAAKIATIREAIAALSVPVQELVAQLGGAPDDLRNLIRVVFAESSIEQISDATRKAIAMRDPALASPAVPAVPITTRNEEAGFTEVVNEDVPYVVRELDGAAAAILDMTSRRVIGYRVYDRVAVPAVKVTDAPDYDAGLLNDYGGGDVNWWQDYLRAEIGRANDHWRSHLSAPEAPEAGWRTIPSDEATIDYVARYGGRCRDCADCDGTCQNGGMPCDHKKRESVIRKVIAALNYGHANGFLPSPPMGGQ